jgi:uncharacterized protein YqcC (DUF446 family)
LYNFISSIWLQWLMFPCYEGSVRLILDMPWPLGTVAGQRFGRFWQEPNQNKGSLHLTFKKTLLDHFISSIWLQWVILPCYESSVGLILDMPAKTKVLCTQHTNQTTVGPFHFLHMAPMDGILAMLWRLCESDFGHAITS